MLLDKTGRLIKRGDALQIIPRRVKGGYAAITQSTAANPPKRQVAYSNDHGGQVTPDARSDLDARRSRTPGHPRSGASATARPAGAPTRNKIVGAESTFNITYLFTTPGLAGSTELRF